MNRSTFASAAIAGALVALGAGCGSSATSALPRRRAGDARPGGLHDRDHERVLADGPGDRWVYRETDGQGGEQKVVVTVTDRTKTIAGIEALVVHDVVTEDGELVEDTFDWYAQDADGNIWYLGEATKSSRTARSRRRPARGSTVSTERRPASRCRRPRTRSRLPAGVLRRRGGGHRYGAVTRRVGGSARGLVPRRVDDEGLHATASRDPRAQALCEGRRPRARARNLRRADREELLSSRRS